MLQWRLPFQIRVYSNHQYKAERPMDDSDSQNHPTGISVVVDEIQEDDELHEDIGDNLFIKLNPGSNGRVKCSRLTVL